MGKAETLDSQASYLFASACPPALKTDVKVRFFDVSLAKWDHF
jgi:hypothetical protein